MMDTEILFYHEMDSPLAGCINMRVELTQKAFCWNLKA